MKIIDIEQRSNEWMEARRGKITGTKLKNIVVKKGTGKKIGYYELIADRLSIPTDEDPMARGTRLEDEAVKRFEKEYDKKVEQVGLCVRDDNENIAVSPDGVIENRGVHTEHLEIKCISSAKHLEAYFEKQIPKEYEMQVLQSFIVNDDLARLYFIFYDPRVPVLDFHVIEVKREDVQDDVQTYLEYQRNILKEIDELTLNLSF